MARCTKCNYLLVLLPKKNKYKCAKCSSLFAKREIDNKEFRNYNQRQRETDIETLNLEIKQQKEEKLKKRIERQKKLIERKKRLKLTEEERKQRKKEYDRKYYYQHREDKLLQKKLWRQTNNQHYREWKKQHRLKQREKIRQQDRIQFWRKQQKALALQRLENNEYKAPKPEIQSSVSTYSLTQLLFFKLFFKVTKFFIYDLYCLF